MTARLITIPFSHFCEKARWALDRCGVAYEEDGHLPLFHYATTYRAGATRTVPVVIDGATIVRDSTDIVAWADKHRPGALLPLSGADDALGIEDGFDNHFGPATRRWAYHHVLPNRDAVTSLAARAPRWERALLALARPLAVSYLRRSLKIDEAGVERSRKKIEAAFARVADVLRDGRPYLLGDRFTVADLTFASLAAPVILPAEHPVPLALELFPAEARAQIEAWRATPAGEYVLRLYAEDRAAPCTDEHAARARA